MSAESAGPDEITAGGERDEAGATPDGRAGGAAERRELSFDGYDVVADTKVALSPVVIVDRRPGAGTR